MWPGRRKTTRWVKGGTGGMASVYVVGVSAFRVRQGREGRMRPNIGFCFVWLSLWRRRLVGGGFKRGEGDVGAVLGWCEESGVGGGGQIVPAMWWMLLIDKG